MDNGDELLGVFSEAVAVSLREMAQVEAFVRESGRFTGLASGDVTATLRLMNSGEGWLVLSFPRNTATGLAQRILADSGTEADDGMIRDCAGELGNVFAGQAKAQLVGTPHHFTFGTPSVTTGSPAVPEGEWWVAEFVSEAGPFTLQLRLPT